MKQCSITYQPICIKDLREDWEKKKKKKQFEKSIFLNLWETGFLPQELLAEYYKIVKASNINGALPKGINLKIGAVMVLSKLI